MKLVIDNRSGWPDWWVRPICKWIAHRAKIYECTRFTKFTLVIANTSKKTFIAGRSRGHSARVRVHRRFQPKGGFPYTTKYWRYKWSMSYQLMNRLEGFVDIVAHEMYHTTGGRPGLFTGSNGRCDAQDMEMACERFARETVAAFREEWPSARIRQLGRNSKRPEKVVDKKTEKILAAHKKLVIWRKKLKTATTKVQKYARIISRLERLS